MIVYLWIVLTISWAMAIEQATNSVWSAVADAQEKKRKLLQLSTLFSAIWFAIMCGSFYFIVTNG